MRIFRKSAELWFSKRLKSYPCNLYSLRPMSSSEIATALRPFYFSVHPDLFGQYPSERAVNENSLKLLSSFLENVRSDKSPKRTVLTFYLKPKQTLQSIGNLESVKIELKEKDVEKTIESILSSCKLSTTYVDNIRKKKESYRRSFTTVDNLFKVEHQSENFRNIKYATDRTIQSQYLRQWLENNIEQAREKVKICEPVMEEIHRLKSQISETLGIKELILDCGWNIRHYRGCLASFQVLACHHPEEMKNLNGKIVVFGGDTGISLDGHVLLNSGEVRHNWLDFIKRINEENAVLSTLPAFEKSVSRVLRDIKVVRRKFQPKTMAKKYKTNLIRLTTTLSDHLGRYGYPKMWPESLSDYELVVETEAGPLMVSPTGQFIVPASCPSFLLVNFITDNMQEAKILNQHYQSHKHIEKNLVQKCSETFELLIIQKDDNIPPDQMISCCSQLLRHKDVLYDLLKHSLLYVTNYYSVMSDGQLCIPWNWKL